MPGLPGWARFREVVMGRRWSARRRSIVVPGARRASPCLSCSSAARHPGLSCSKESSSLFLKLLVVRQGLAIDVSRRGAVPKWMCCRQSLPLGRQELDTSLQFASMSTGR